MDDQTKIDRDLPEPVRRQSDTPSERARKQHYLSLAFFTFVSAYSFLHKMIVPFALSFTSLYPGPYTKLDYFFLLPVTLTWLLAYRPESTKVVSFLAGMTVAYGLLEILEVSQGHYVGWLSFSRLLSSVPAAFLCLFFLITGNFKRSPSSVVLGVAFLVTLHFFGGVFLDLRNTAPVTAPAQVVQKPVPVTGNIYCGASELQIKKEDSVSFTSEVTVEECGFTPSTIRLKGSQVRMRNRSGKAMNIHLVYWKKQKLSTGWNVLLPNNSEVTKDIQLLNQEVAMIYSDSQAGSGIVAVIQEPVEKQMHFSRFPVRIEAVDGI